MVNFFKSLEGIFDIYIYSQSKDMANLHGKLEPPTLSSWQHLRFKYQSNCLSKSA